MGKNRIRAIWTDPIPQFEKRIRDCLDSAIADKPVYLFFRADDIGVPGKRFFDLMALFSVHRVPLCLAVVPSWLTRPRWEQIRTGGGETLGLWSWHQHGWRHFDHEKTGDKNEFGQSRPIGDIYRDLANGSDISGA